VSFQKIFNVSLHRSGTQSVHDLLVRSGVSSVHWPGVINGVNYQELIAGHEMDTSYMAALLEPVIKLFTALSDVPIPALFETLDGAYPGSAFILTFRSPFDWVRSVRNHIGDRDFKAFERVQYWRYLAGKPMSLRTIEDAQLYSAYLTHHRDVLTFFEKRHNLLFINLQDREAGEKICAFLGFPPLRLRHIDSYSCSSV
jgi:Sulfotransferase domain